jgi:hypothetical protein
MNSAATSRRGFLAGIAAMIAAPYVVRNSSVLMPVRNRILPAAPWHQLTGSDNESLGRMALRKQLEFFDEEGRLADKILLSGYQYLPNPSGEGLSRLPHKLVPNPTADSFAEFIRGSDTSKFKKPNDVLSLVECGSEWRKTT